MDFILSDQFLLKLAALRQDYQNGAKVSFESIYAPNLVRRFLGAKDIKTRDKQIALIEKWLAVLDTELHPERILLPQAPTAPDDSPSQLIHIPAKAIQNQVTALRLLVTVCFYLKDQIDKTYSSYSMRSGEYSILEQLINQAMGITADNPMDEETQACCFLTTKRFLTEQGRFETVNSKATRFTEQQWNEFLTWVLTQCDRLNEHYKTTYPITQVMMPLLSKPFQLAGYTTGFILGEMVARSTKLVKGHLAVTAAISSGLMLVMGPTAGMGIILLAPTYAGRILDTFCGVSLAWALGTAGTILGQGIGLGVGVPLDLSCKFIYHTCKSLKSYYASQSAEKLFTGICLLNGERMVNGQKLHVIDTASLEPGNTEQIVHVEADDDALKITFNDKETRIPWSDDQPAYLHELKKLLLEPMAGEETAEQRAIITEPLLDNNHEDDKKEFQLVM